jgi:hypothetical protein
VLDFRADIDGTHRLAMFSDVQIMPKEKFASAA